MLSLEEYIEKRKTEDGINEFDVSQKINNIRTCINYIFEYFDQYLSIQGAERHTITENEKIRKYEKSLRNYSHAVQNWLVSIYDAYGCQINRTIGYHLIQSEAFPFMYEESEFRALSYDCYAKIIKDHAYLKNETELLCQFIKEYHRRESERYPIHIPNFSQQITDWLNSTLEQYHVNLVMGLAGYLSYFWDTPESWPKQCRIKTDECVYPDGFKYNFRTSNNIFNINSFYLRYAHKPFIKGHKKQIEVVMMYLWLHKLEGDTENYWDKYLESCND